MRSEDGSTFQSPEALTSFRQETLAGLKSRWRERMSFLTGAEAEVESLLSLAESVQDPRVQQLLAERLGQIRAELNDLESRATAAGAVEDFSREPLVTGPVESSPELASAANGTATPLLSGAEAAAAPDSHGEFEERVRQETSAFDFSALLSGVGNAGAPVAYSWYSPGAPETPSDAAPEPQEAPVALLQATHTEEPSHAVLPLRVQACGISFPFEVNGATIRIGRRDPRQRVEPDLDLWPDDAVSRRHGEIRLRGGRHFYVDLGSLNGSMLNGRRLPADEETLLSPGDELMIGSQCCIQVLTAS